MCDSVNPVRATRPDHGRHVATPEGRDGSVTAPGSGAFPSGDLTKRSTSKHLRGGAERAFFP